MIKLHMGGVPEYFNLPIYQAIENQLFSEKGIELQWTNISQGTGAMSQMLSEGSLDLAVILTEGIVKSIIEGNPSRIIKNYVASPLTWGVHVPYGRSDIALAPIRKRKFAISRYGSGSHLMSFLLAKRNEWELSDLNFEVINNLDGARESFRKKESDVFLWEKYTTKPLVDSNEFSLVDSLETPWPCFVLAASNKALKNYPNEIRELCQIINKQCNATQKNPTLSALIGEKFNLGLEDSANIVSEVKWSTNLDIDEAAIHLVMESLTELKLITSGLPIDQLIHRLN